MISLLIIISSIYSLNSLYFVGASDILPPPLSKAEEEYFLNMASASLSAAVAYFT